MLRVDGSWGEGGGQILRTSLALSALTGKPVEIYNIRARRPNPGLRPQHLMVIRTLAKITGAKVKGDSIGSTKVVFEPGRIRSGEFTVNIGAAGSVTLLLQALLPALLYAPGPTALRVIGGTDVPFAPTGDYFVHVFLPALALFGPKVRARVVRRGYYPEGGGVMTVRVEPVDNLKPVRLVRAGEYTVKSVSHCGGLPGHVARRQLRAAERKLGIPVEGEVYTDSHGIGSGITLWTEGRYLGASSLGKKGKPAEKVGEEAAEELLEFINSGAPVDKYLADQLIPYMALASGRSTIFTSEVTSHTLTNLWVVRKFLEVSGEVEGNRIEVEGAGVERGGEEEAHQ